MTSHEKALKKKRDPHKWFHVTEEAKYHHSLDKKLKESNNWKTAKR